MLDGLSAICTLLFLYDNICFAIKKIIYISIFFKLIFSILKLTKNTEKINK